MTVLGNTRLVEYGIGDDGSDWRVHVCITAKVIYVYRTERARRFANDSRFRDVPVYTGSIMTARGRLVPPAAIGCSRQIIPDDILARHPIARTDPPTVKGNKAAQIVAEIMEDEWFPLKIKPGIVTNATMQIEGADIVFSIGGRIQVKCDYDGGEKELGGTGNLFLQTHECNPFNAH